MPQEVTLETMLAARDRRVEKQDTLLKNSDRPLICFTMNIAGPIKNSPLIRRGFLQGCAWLKAELALARLQILHEEQLDAITGMEGYFCVDADALEIKRITSRIEDTDRLGRLFDMDVLGTDGLKITRSQIGLSDRTCLICGKPAAVCARSRSHSVADLQKETGKILDDYFRRKDVDSIARNAVRALLYEVLTTPKPGLVDRTNSGSHKDMDIFTYADSTAALAPYFSKCAALGMETAGKSEDVTFEKIRKEGMLAERDMLITTKGINTHKGAIFSLGLMCAALGRLPHELWASHDHVLDECAAMVKGITQADFEGLNSENAGTAGQKLYLEYGITGIRGQAEAGYPAVRNYGYPVLEKLLSYGQPIDRAGSTALLAIIASSTDTNLITRSSRETQLQIQKEIRALLQEEPIPTEDTLKELDRKFISMNLSPGGSADLLGLCYMLYFSSQDE